MSDLISRKALLDSLEKEQEIYENNGAIPSFWTALSVIRHAPTVKTEPQWIPCSERLPTESGKYLVTVKNLTRFWILKEPVFVCNYEFNEFMFQGWEDNEVIAWMPLPEPYKGE